jgi:GTP-binding protein
MIKITQADFIKGATKPDSYPATGLPEFAFFGRSNAGKSSLINMIVSRKSLVKTGSRPGMTRVINFFKVNGAFVLADLPGYGYAQRSAEENRAFDRMLADYAQERKELKTLFFLIDMRRLPGEVERNTVEYFEKLGVEVVIVGTKADKLTANEARNALFKWSAFFNRSADLIPMTSASKKTGRDHILRVISERL